MTRAKWLFVISLVGMAVGASVLILHIPSLIRSGGQGDVRAVVLSACLTVTFVVGVRYWQPSTSISDESN